MIEQDAKRYVNRAQQLGICPNFWLSIDYLRFQEDARLEENGQMMWVQEGDMAIFPPLPIHGRLGDIVWPLADGFQSIRIWSDFVNYSLGEPVEFLDWEYTYRSDNFADLRGGQWAVFRKNIRKWPKANPLWEYTTDLPSEVSIHKLLLRWLDARPDAEIHDDTSLLQFVFEGRHRAFLREGGRLVGINVWDAYNDRYLMYRYCLADPEEPFLDEFLRHQFYQSHPHKIVIDGGSLGNKGLERFKDRLNPVRKREIFTKEWGQ